MSASIAPLQEAAEHDAQTEPLLEPRMELQQSRASSLSRQSHSSNPTAMSATTTIAGVARHTLGLILLLVVVFLWTGSSFLASTIFAAGEYSKPFFVTYFNTAVFMLALIPLLARRAYKNLRHDKSPSLESLWKPIMQADDSANRSAVLKSDDEDEQDQHLSRAKRGHANPPMLSIRATARLSFEFCLLWFTANYFATACLQYTTVASSTILSSTSSVWTLLFGALSRIERFTLRKLLGVLASLAGVALISRADLANESNDASRGRFPHKTRAELAIGDVMAFLGAVIYGVYTIVLKKKCGGEEHVSMPLFFGFVGVFNTIFLWPLFPVLHLIGLEPFALPPTKHVWTIILVNSVSALASDVAWAYAMLLTSPLLVTVGLSLTIPLSLIGQLVLNAQSASFVYWFGAAIVFCSFVFVNHESKEEEKKREALQDQTRPEAAGSHRSYGGLSRTADAHEA